MDNRKLNVLLVTVITGLILFYVAFIEASEVKQPLGSLSNTANKKLTTEQVLNSIRIRLLSDFNRRLKNPQVYEKYVIKSSGLFPEGDLFPYIYPALAYVNIALKDPAQKANSIRNAKKLIDLAIKSVIKHVHPPYGRLDRLNSYKKHATYLGQLNLALGAYSLISEDDDYDKLHAKLSDILHQALIDSKGTSLCSFPEYSWSFDTIPVLLSLKLYDIKTSQTRSSVLIKKHLNWIGTNATHPLLKLPYSIIGNDRELPRGCDLSFRFCLLPHLDREYAEKLYKYYIDNYWIDHVFMAGFAEWPKGKKRYQDMDSGPVVMGIGLGATGLGIGATIAMNDQIHFERLIVQLASINIIRPLFIAAQQYTTDNTAQRLQMIELDDKCYTGFLFGDAMLFYCITWQPWIKTEQKSASREK